VIDKFEKRFYCKLIRPKLSSGSRPNFGSMNFPRETAAEDYFSKPFYKYNAKFRNPYKLSNHWACPAFSFFQAFSPQKFMFYPDYFTKKERLLTIDRAKL